jgi:hypothetical protein
MKEEEKKTMPRFIDHHPAPTLSQVEFKAMQSTIKAGKADKNGVKPLNVFVGRADAWCLSDAPNAEAVKRTHEAMGLPAAKIEVSEVTVIG